MSKNKTIESLFPPDGRCVEVLKCPKCKNVELFSTATMAIAVAIVDKNRTLKEIKDLVINFDESLWQCERCSCVFDDYATIIF